jgi:hypothetical protein
LFWKLKLVSTKDPEAIAATKYPLVLVLGEPAVEHRIRGTIQALFEEDGVLGVMPADLEDGTQLLCVGFADQTAAHQSRSDEMKDLYTHLQGIRLDPTTPNGHKILFHDHKDMQEREKFAFDFIDTNHDGKIDEHELQYVLQDSERARQYLEKYHRTADGSISLEDAKYTHGVLEVCQTYGMIVRAFVRHDRAQRDHLYQAWMTEKSAAYGHMPRPGVLNYCGPELAVYFEFLAFYLNYLYVPAAIGIVVYGYNYAYPEPDQVLNPVGVVSFGLFCLVWASVFLCQWGIRLTSLLHTWRDRDHPTVQAKEAGRSTLRRSMAPEIRDDGRFRGHGERSGVRRFSDSSVEGCRGIVGGRPVGDLGLCMQENARCDEGICNGVL